VRALDGQEYNILGNTVCAYINDCTMSMQHPFTLREWEEMNNSSQFGSSCFNGFSYNLKSIMHVGGKVFFVASANIDPGRELFIPYTW
jgi:hypothetical protein